MNLSLKDLYPWQSRLGDQIWLPNANYGHVIWVYNDTAQHVGMTSFKQFMEKLDSKRFVGSYDVKFNPEPPHEHQLATDLVQIHRDTGYDGHCWIIDLPHSSDHQRAVYSCIIEGLKQSSSLPTGSKMLTVVLASHPPSNPLPQICYYLHVDVYRIGDNKTLRYCERIEDDQLKKLSQ